MTDDRTKLNRRKLLQGLSIAGAAGIAGCQGLTEKDGGDSGGGGGDSGGGGGGGDSGGSDGGELGERVPNVIYEYWTGSGGVTQAQEDFLQVIQGNLKELGIKMQVRGQSASAAITEAVNDKRDHNFMLYNHGATPDRLDPDEFVIRYAADQCVDGINLQQYANCEQTDPAHLQRSAVTQEERQELVNKAILKQSKDWVAAPQFPYITFGAYRSDIVELGDKVGKAGVSRDSFWNLIDVDIKQGDTVICNTPNLASSSHFHPGSTGMLTKWAQIPYSTLTTYTGDFELTNMLAEEVEVSDDAKSITVSLRDHKFTNGRKITADDVKFTFEYINQHVDQNLYQSKIPLESIEVVDDQTATFHTSQATLSLITKTLPKWGILPREQWDGVENLDDFEPHQTDEGLIGSGPFQLVDFQAGSHAEFKPNPHGHPVHDVSHDVILQKYADVQPAFQALKSGDLNQAVALGSKFANQAEDVENVELSIVSPHTTHIIYPQCQRPPSMLPEFRHAIGVAYNRKAMNDLAFGGRAEPLLYSGNSLSPNHPYFDEDQHVYYTDKVEGDRQEAKSILKEAGFGWDDNGRLHYPPDVDLTPQWPKGTTPGAHAPDKFPCLNKDNEWVPPENR